MKKATLLLSIEVLEHGFMAFLRTFTKHFI